METAKEATCVLKSNVSTVTHSHSDVAAIIIPDQAVSQVKTEREATSYDYELPPLQLKTTDRNISDRYSDIIKISDKQVNQQSNIVQNIVQLCYELAGYTGYVKYCNKIITLCEQLMSETRHSSNMIVTLCHGRTNLDIAPSKVQKKAQTQNESTPKNTEIPLTTAPVVSIKVESHIENDIADDTGLNSENSVDVIDTTNDSDMKVEAIGTEFESEPISVKNSIGQDKSKRLRSSNFFSFDDLNIEGLNDDSDDSKCQSDSDSDWELESKTTKTVKKQQPVKNPEIVESNGTGMKINAENNEGYDEEVGFSCKLCHQVCKSEINLKKHYETIHTPGNSDKKKLSCDICESSFSNKKLLSGHKTRVHSTVRRYKCDICSYTSVTACNLKQHKISHSSFCKYQCDICGASFKLRNSLIRHRVTHNEICDHVCQFCPKRFNARHKVIKHEKTHSDVYKYHCEFCGKKIRRSWNFKSHMRTHTGDKPYTCERCGQTFAHNVTRKKHMTSCFVVKPKVQT